MASRAVTVTERRARLGRRHILEPGLAPDVEGLCDELLALHATDPATIYLAVGARRADSTVADVDAALFDRRSVFRTLVMRRTLFVVSTTVAPIIEAASQPAVAATERKRLEKFLTENGFEEPRAWLDDLFADVLEALDEPVGAGQGRSGRELTTAVPRLATKIVAGRGTRNEVEMAVTTRALGLMAVEGLIIRGRPSAGWTGRQYAWHRRDRWWPDDEAPVPEPNEAAARVAVVERWLRRFGPGTETDLVWWTGWTKTATRAALAEVDTVEVGLEEAGGGEGEEPGLLLADDLDPVEDPEPWAALLPALDPTAMGWKQRGWYLGDHQGPLFDRNGNIGPTVWVDGRIVGGWAQRPDAEIAVELLEDVGRAQRALIDAETERLQRFVGDTVVKPSFPTPLQRQLQSDGAS